LDSITLGKGKGMAEATKVTIHKRHRKFSQALLAFTVLSLGHATNHHWQDFPLNLSIIRELVKYKTKLCTDVMYYGWRMVQVSPLDHDGSGDNWVVFHCFSISSQMVATLMNGYCSIADHLLNTI
jgi:hypothetical protein